jgi:hypothetical protein
MTAIHPTRHAGLPPREPYPDQTPNPNPPNPDPAPDNFPGPDPDPFPERDPEMPEPGQITPPIIS